MGPTRKPEAVPRELPRQVPADDPRSSVHADNIIETCGQCHDNVTANFASFQPHNDPTNPDDHFGVYVVWIFMTSLLIGVFAFFGFHDLLCGHS